MRMTLTRIMRITTAAALLSLVAVSSAAENAPENGTDSKFEPYPTAAVTDYVIGCMLANGPSPDSLRKCSCSVDIIAAAIPFQEYEKVETLMRMQQVPGAGRAGALRNTNWAKDSISHFKEVQAESTLRCF
jgi:hypothetical protein